MTNNLTNQAIAAAKDLPDLINKLQFVDQTLATQLTGKTLIASKSPPAVLLAAVLAYVSTKYGLGWSPDVDATVAGAVLLGVGYAMRSITSAPIKGVVSMPEPVVSADTTIVSSPAPTEVVLPTVTTVK